MEVSVIMTKNVITCERGDTLNTALAKMKKYNIHRLPVVEGKNVLGLLELKNVVTKDIDIQSTKVENYITSASTASPEHDLQKVIELLLNSGLRAVPVTDKGNLVGIVSESDVVRVASKLMNTKKTCGDIAVKCEYVSRSDSVGKVKKIMFNKNVSRVPVLDGQKVIGIVGTMDMIKLSEGKEKMEMRGRTKERGVSEKMTTEKAGVESFMHDAAVLQGNAPLEKALELLQKNEEVIITNGDIGIITPKDILELLVSGPKKQVYVQITGLHGESSEVVAGLDEATTRFVQKIGRMIDGIQYLFVHVERQNDHGGGDRKIRYVMRARIGTPLGLFVSHSMGWKPLDVAQDVLGKLEREIMKSYGKMQKHQRAKKSGQMRKFRG
ncbi:MAG: CBS domain-containing protein [Candidatus Aenigmarchaeota archaeon]|nr:CBS domain-containing protein [Candidatus Aenigmarchaeota archaeon]